MKVFDNKKFDKKLYLKHKFIIRIGNYLGGNVDLKFKCTKCNNIWDEKPSILMNRKYCNFCKFGSFSAKFTNSYIDNKLLEINNNIIRIDDYLGIDEPIKFKCLICDHIWKTGPYKLINNVSVSGCPNCAGNIKLTNETFDIKLLNANKNIHRVEDYVGGKSKIKFECEVCLHQWPAKPANILYAQKGCPKCAGVIKITNEMVDERLLKLNSKIIRLGDVNGANNNINWKCGECKFEWLASVWNISSGRRGCPQCHKSFGEKAIICFLEKFKIGYCQSYKVHLKEYVRPRLIDFYIEKYNLFIEWNGIQHYQAVKFYGNDFTLSKLEEQKIRDELIRNYCISNKINLLEIDSRVYFDLIYKPDKSIFYKKLEIDLIEYFTDLMVK